MEVGGDFYDAFEARDGAWGVAIGDVCGKGAEAAALTSLARHTLRAAARYEDSPVGVLAALNRAVLAERGDMRFLTAAYAQLEPLPSGGARVRGSAGGHPPPVVLRRDGTHEPAAPGGTLLGVIDDPALDETGLELAPGEVLVFYTDGVTEAAAPERQLSWRDVAELAGGPEGDADDIAARLEDGVYRLAGGAPGDDVALLVVKV
jgi:serine phosphatase RsbU (regulator of sigma subunit)